MVAVCDIIIGSADVCINLHGWCHAALCLPQVSSWHVLIRVPLVSFPNCYDGSGMWHHHWLCGCVHQLTRMMSCCLVSSPSFIMACFISVSSLFRFLITILYGGRNIRRMNWWWITNIISFVLWTVTYFLYVAGIPCFLCIYSHVLVKDPMEPMTFAWKRNICTSHALCHTATFMSRERYREG